MQTLLADGHDSDSWSSSVESSMDLIGFIKTGSMKEQPTSETGSSKSANSSTVGLRRTADPVGRWT